MEISFYEMSRNIIGELPNTLYWLYDFGTIFLVISAGCLFVIPIFLIIKKFVRG